MKNKILFLGVLSFVLISCNEKNPTEGLPDQATKEIRTINLQDNSSKLIAKEVGHINTLGFVDNSTVYYTTVYTYGKPSSGYTSAENIVSVNIDSPIKSMLFNAPSYIHYLRNRNVTSLIFESGGDIYKVASDGSSTVNLTNSDTVINNSGVLNEKSNELFVGAKFYKYNQINKINLTTNLKSNLIENSLNYYYPLFLTQDRTRLIYLESNNVVSPIRGYIKILEINNPQNQKSLLEVSTQSMVDISKSNNDIITFHSDGKIYMINIPDDEIRVIAMGNSVDISADGSKIIYSDGKNNLWLYSVIEGNIQQVYFEELKNLYFPRFSPNGQKIVFVDSEAPLY